MSNLQLRTILCSGLLLFSAAGCTKIESMVNPGLGEFDFFELKPGKSMTTAQATKRLRVYADSATLELTDSLSHAMVCTLRRLQPRLTGTLHCEPDVGTRFKIVAQYDVHADTWGTTISRYDANSGFRPAERLGWVEGYYERFRRSTPEREAANSQALVHHNYEIEHGH